MIMCLRYTTEHWFQLYMWGFSLHLWKIIIIQWNKKRRQFEVLSMYDVINYSVGRTEVYVCPLTVFKKLWTPLLSEITQLDILYINQNSFRQSSDDNGPHNPSNLSCSYFRDFVRTSKINQLSHFKYQQYHM